MTTFIPEINIDNGLYIFTTYISDYLQTHLNDAYNFEISLRILSLKEQLKIRNINTHDVRVKLLVNKLFTLFIVNLIRYKLGRTDKFNPWEPIEFSYNQYGKPELPLEQFTLTASSSNRLLVIMIQVNDPSAIGVDLSHSHQNISSLTILEDFEAIFHPSESQQLQMIEEELIRYYVFNQLWTLKEALTKLLGTGLNIDLSKVCFNLNGEYINPHGSATDFNDQNQMVLLYNIDWKSGITVEIEGLQDSSTDQLQTGKLYCKSGTLIGSESKHGALPVVISIITQHDYVPRNYNVDMLAVLQEQGQ